LPANRYFDPREVGTISKANGSNQFSAEENAGLAAKVSANITNQCAGNLGIDASSTSTSGANLVATEVYTLDMADRRYEKLLKTCCEDNSGCDQWVVNAAYKTKVSWTVKANREIGVNGSIQCGGTRPATSTIPSGTEAAPSAAASSAGSVGVAAQVNVGVGDKSSATLSSEGWNVVELVPLKWVCKQRRQTCRSADEPARTSQYLCDSPQVAKSR
jgi:hypothetical protein